MEASSEGAKEADTSEATPMDCDDLEVFPEAIKPVPASSPAKQTGCDILSKGINDESVAGINDEDQKDEENTINKEMEKSKEAAEPSMATQLSMQVDEEGGEDEKPKDSTPKDDGDAPVLATTDPVDFKNQSRIVNDTIATTDKDSPSHELPSKFTEENKEDAKTISDKVEDDFVQQEDENENDSQESMGLVIDEKMNIPEDEQSETKDSTPEKSAEPIPIDRVSKDTEEETSEASVSTAIDANETITKTKVLDIEEKESLKSPNNLIDTDHEVNENETKKKEIDESKDVEIVAEKEIPIIEIDDDDEDEENPKSESENAEHKSTFEENIEKLNEEMPKLIASEAASPDQDKTSTIIPAKDTEDVEMKDLAEASAEVPSEEPKEVTTKSQEDPLLKEAPTPAEADSPKPAEEDESLIDDTRDQVFYNKECINYECPKSHKQFYRIPQFALSYFKVAKKRCKLQYICSDCYDKALDMYEEFCGLLVAKQPLLLQSVATGRQEFVEIIDSSDEDESDSTIEKEKESAHFSNNDLSLIESELESCIKSVLTNVEIQNQLTWSKEILMQRAKRLKEESNFIDIELSALQKRADNMHVSLYQCPKIKIRQLQPLDLNSGRPYAPHDSEIALLPPIGEIQRHPIQLNEMYYAVKNKAIASWVPCKAVELVEIMGAQKCLKHYKVKFLKSNYQMLKTVSVKHMAYYDPPPVRLPIGSRVIAYFDASSLSRGKEKLAIQSAFYPGIIAEPLKPNNKYRYLIFYDDGYTQYVSHKDVRLVCSVAENVWEDVHPGSRDFIQKYLTQYSINRPMVQTQKGQSMTTESNGKWIYARVVDIDCSLIQMQFDGPKCHTEWIYRGSLRLGPVFKEYQKSLQKYNIPISRLPRRTEPFIRYTEDEEASAAAAPPPQRSSSTEARAVAKKSVSRPDVALNNAAQPSVPIVRHLNNSTIYLEDENKPKGKVVYYTAKRNLPPLSYQPHKCSPSCLFKITHNLNAYSPLSKPLLSGWERFIVRQKIKKVVAYRAPCGKIMRNMKELHHYLRVVDSVLNVDNFDFSPDTSCLAEYVIESAIVQKRDISGGQEKMAIPLVNYYDNTMPPECKYAAQRIPTEGVNLNLDEEFLVGCDCEGDCSNKEKCSCWQLTYAGAKYGNPNTPMEDIGYQYKRLYEHVPTGIYECNSRCKCKANCLNRVVQQSLQMKLQVFKTSNRGWGLRCINDVPKGSFICIYAGHLLTEAKANEGGLDAGDEYFAELDYIEVAEQIKEGYESDVEPPEAEEDEDIYAPDHDDDDEFTPSKSFLTRARNKAQKSTRGSGPQTVDEDSQERQVINFNPNADMNENSMRESSIRKLFGKDEACYVMDAKITGNLGRYFNHSCSPNLFVQNVFVDTHDLRFPWVAFFALTHIRAGTELTWNYNYEVGVVPGKVLYCQCGAPNCRLRLL